MGKIKLFILLILFSACKQNGQKLENVTSVDVKQKKASDNSLVVSVDSLSKWTKKEFRAEDLQIIGDTLKIVSGAHYLYYPFGKHKELASVQSIFKNFKLSVKTDTTFNNSGTKVFKFIYRNSFVKLVKEAETGYMEIVYADIVDSEIPLFADIKTGMKKEAYFRVFFNKTTQLNSINNVKMISLVYGISHCYHFNGDTLSSVIMDTDYQLEKG